MAKCNGDRPSLSRNIGIFVSRVQRLLIFDKCIVPKSSTPPTEAPMMTAHSGLRRLIRSRAAATHNILLVVVLLLPWGALGDDDEPALICEKGGGGLVLGMAPNEHAWPMPLRTALYFVGLMWCFLGVGIVADIFMVCFCCCLSSSLSLSVFPPLCPYLIDGGSRFVAERES